MGAIFWTLAKVLPHCERWTEPPSVKQVAGYNRKIPLRFWHSSFFLLETEKKNKSFPSKQKKVCNRGSNPGSSMVPSPLHYHGNTTENGRNLIIQIQFSIFFVIELHGLFFRTVLYSGTPLYGHLVIMVTFFDRPAKRPRPSLIRSPIFFGPLVTVLMGFHWCNLWRMINVS